MMRWNRTVAATEATAHTDGQLVASVKGYPPGQLECFCGHYVSSPDRVSVKTHHKFVTI